MGFIEVPRSQMLFQFALGVRSNGGTFARRLWRYRTCSSSDTMPRHSIAADHTRHTRTLTHHALNSQAVRQNRHRNDIGRAPSVRGRRDDVDPSTSRSSRRWRWRRGQGHHQPGHAALHGHRDDGRGRVGVVAGGRVHAIDRVALGCAGGAVHRLTRMGWDVDGLLAGPPTCRVTGLCPHPCIHTSTIPLTPSQPNQHR